MKNENELKKMQRASFLKMVSMVVFVVVVAVFGSVAWFTMNKENVASGMGVKVSSVPFELASTGTAPKKYLDLFGLSDRTYVQGVRQGDTNEYRTNGVSKLMWRLDTDETSSYNEGFRPGASGTITFDIIPNISEEFYVDCKFNVRTFVATYDEDDDDENPTPISMSEVNATTGENNERAGYHYLNSHILFFKDKSTVGENDENTIYSGYIGTDGLKIHIPENSSGETVTVYWKWVNTFDQMILKSDDSYDDYPLFADNNSDDRDKMITYIKNNYTNIFDELTTANTAAISSIDYAYVKANPTFLSDLIDNYNAADQVIGLNIDYLLLEMSAERGNAPVANN